MAILRIPNDQVPILPRGRDGAKRPSKPSPDAGIPPTPERARHDPVERLDRPIADSSGRIGNPYRVVDTLAAMERRGSITAEMRQAGEDFRDAFALAGHVGLLAAPLERIPSGHSGQRHGNHLEARDQVWRTLQRVGGQSSPAGSCLWHVLGFGMSLREWAIGRAWNGKPVREHTASGILIAALGSLVKPQ